MKILIPFELKQNLRNFMRRAGYGEQNNHHTGISSYTRRLSGDLYPRFHVYIEENRDLQKYLSLHLDQKKPSYAGAHAHNGEYDGEVVEREGSRLMGLIKNELDNQNQVSVEPEAKKGFWNSIFHG